MSFLATNVSYPWTQVRVQDIIDDTTLTTKHPSVMSSCSQDVEEMATTLKTRNTVSLSVVLEASVLSIETPLT